MTHRVPVATPVDAAAVVVDAAPGVPGAVHEVMVNAGRVGRMTSNHEENRCRSRR
ncbi:MAG: hypothetical protein QOG90_1143 [Actinomycetota bacterium]